MKSKTPFLVGPVDFEETALLACMEFWQMSLYLDSSHEGNQYLIKSYLFLMLKTIVPVFFPSNSGILTFWHCPWQYLFVISFYSLL